jgi:hypothetical protein
MFAMVSVMLTAPYITPNSCAMGKNKSPATLVMRPTVAAESPHRAATTNRYLPVTFIFSPSLAVLPPELLALS